MEDVTDRPKRKREARAKASLEVDATVRGRIREGTSAVEAPRERARVAAERGARRAGDVVASLPEVEITAVDVGFEWRARQQGEARVLEVEVSVVGFSRGRLDGCASLAVHAAATALVEDVDARPDQWTLRRTRVTKGGRREYGPFDPPIDIAVITVSDAVVEGHKDDRAGRAVQQSVEGLEERGIAVGWTDELGDDADAIEDAIQRASDAGCEVVLTVGGTGITHTDVTVETVEEMLNREIPGIMEAARGFGQERTALAMLSRGIAGMVGDTLVVTVPGSTAGARETCQALFPAVFRAVETVRKSRRELVE